MINNKAQSTTDNIWGIYDMNEGASELTAGYLLNSKGTSIRNAYGAGLANDRGNVNTKYKTIYEHNASSDSYLNNYIYGNNLSRIGEAILELQLLAIFIRQVGLMTIQFLYLLIVYFSYVVEDTIIVIVVACIILIAFLVCCLQEILVVL